MIELSAIIILFVGLAGMSVIIFKKIPVLAELPVEEFENAKILEGIKKNAKKNNIFKLFSPEVLLQKLLSKIRILTLKTDNKTSAWLTKLRQRSVKERDDFSDDYWKKIRKKK